MNKKTFTKHLNRIKEMFEAEEKITKSLQLIGSKDFPTDFSLEKPITFMTEVLKDSMDDKDDWIGYFMYELDFGKHKMAKNCVVEKDGTKVSLQNMSDLYNYIKKNNE